MHFQAESLSDWVVIKSLRLSIPEEICKNILLDTAWDRSPFERRKGREMKDNRQFIRRPFF